MKGKWMKRKWMKSSRWLLPVGSLIMGVTLTAAATPGYQDPQQPAPDNTKQNKNQTNPSADQQKMNAADRELTRKIRKAIHDDSNLSTYAHNIKIISQDGKVTLRGPVRSETAPQRHAQGGEGCHRHRGQEPHRLPAFRRR